MLSLESRTAGVGSFSSSEEFSDELLAPPLPETGDKRLECRRGRPNERRELPTPTQYPSARERIAVAMIEGINAGKEGAVTAAFSGNGLRDILKHQAAVGGFTVLTLKMRVCEVLCPDG